LLFKIAFSTLAQTRIFNNNFKGNHATHEKCKIAIRLNKPAWPQQRADKL